jgi:hypothetical protein
MKSIYESYLKSKNLWGDLYGRIINKSKKIKRGI